MVCHCSGVFVGMLTMGQVPARWCGENLSGKQLGCSCLVDDLSIMGTSLSSIQISVWCVDARDFQNKYCSTVVKRSMHYENKRRALIDQEQTNKKPKQEEP